MQKEKYLEFKEFIKEYVEKIKEEIKEEVNNLSKEGIFPKLLIIQIGDNFASNKYVAGKLKDCEEVGINCTLAKLKEETTEEELLNYIKNDGKDFDGIIVQLPLPKHINVDSVIKAIPVEKDVDGFKVESDFVPCTPLGVYNLLMEVFKDDKKLEGKNVVILGRSEIVGKPMANLLIEKTNSTVTICNSHTKNIAKITNDADIIISAIGKANFVKGYMVKDGAVIIDVGINRSEDNKLCGDVDFESLRDNIQFISPVPGGVGLLTRLSLLENVCKAAKIK